MATHQPHNSLSLVATCGRDTSTIDVFRDVGVNDDYALSSFSVPSAFAPLSLVSVVPSSTAIVALCCGVEVSEKVGLGVVPLSDTSASAQCDVREVFGVSQPTCAVPMAGSPIVAVGCAVPGGYGITAVVVETTQRIHTISDSSADAITCLASYGEVVVSGSRDGCVDLWDLRRAPRGPSLSVMASRAMRGDATSALCCVGGGVGGAGGGGASVPPLLLSGSVDGLLRVWDLRAPGGVAAGQEAPLARKELDGPVLALASLPGRDAGTLNVAVSTARTLSMLRLEPAASCAPGGGSPSSGGAALATEQVIACRTSAFPHGEVVTDAYHDIIVVPRFAGTSNTYVLCGAELGSVEAFRVRHL